MSALTHRLRRPVAGMLAATSLAVAGSGLGVLPAQAAPGHRVLLRTLVVSSGDPATQALAVQLNREGIPYTTVNLAAAGRPIIDAAFLEDTATGTARFQAVILPNQAGGGLTAAELTALSGYEAAYGVRQVNGYDYPGASMGLAAPSYAGALDGAAASVAPAGLAGPFGYLSGSLTVDDIDPAVLETYGYLAQPATGLPAGQSFTPLVTATAGGATGVLTGVYAHDGREELVIPAGFNQYMQWFDTLAPGIVSWATRGVHLGYQRNYFAVQVDDVLLPDSRWSATGNCTPGDGCVDPTVSTADIRMTPADVTKLVAWQNANGFKLDMVFNAYGSDAAKADNAGVDPLTDAYLANQASFSWINHTYSHAYLGCIQIAPTVQGQSWHCATTATETPRQDPEILQQASGGLYWASPAQVTQQVADNITWAGAHGLTGFDPKELVTGEHSGLASLPQQTADNPFLAPALAALGVRYTASDASREVAQRTLAGGTTVTVPRHPMNIFYNAGTYADEVDEYNWIYTSAANGGSGICENNATSTCITPLATATAAQAKASFDSYLKPFEVRNALKYVLTNDPRPFYAHQSNLAEDGILYPVLDGVLAAYRGSYDTTKTPLQQLGLTGQAQAMQRLSDWTAVSASVDGYIDATGVHLPATSVAVPVTVPAGSTVAGASLSSYAGALSGWLPGSSTVVPATPAGGYLVSAPATLPGAPTAVVAVAGSTTSSVTWAVPASNGGSPLTGFVVSAFAGTATTPVITAPAPAGVTTLLLTGLTNGTSYRFSVAAVNAVGTGPASALSAAVTPSVALGAVPMAVVASPGSASVTVSWAPPSVPAGVTGYRVRMYVGASATAARTVNLPLSPLNATLSGLTNGTAYTFDVASLYGSAVGPASARTAAVTPSLTAQTTGAPIIVSVVPGANAVVVTWQPAPVSGAAAPSGYRVRAYVGATGTGVARTVNVSAATTTATVSGLVNGVGYSLDVTVMYPGSTDATSARSVVVVPLATAPSAPRIGSATAGSPGGAVTATARWSPPTANGGSSITGYVVTASALAADGTVTGRTSSAVLPASQRSYSMPLPAVGAYSFTVVARNAIGASVPSAASNQVTGQ